MSESDSTKVYNNYVRANLPNGMSYDTGTGIYDINNHSFFTFKNSNWYYKYISKYGYSASSEKPSGSAYAVIGFEPALVFDFKNNYYRKSATDSTFSSAMTHTRASSATLVNSSGTLVTVGNNVPRTGHHIYNGSAWVNEGILHESESRTNIIENSNDLTTAEWRYVAASNSANAGVSPDGASNANKVVTTTSFNRHFTYLEKNLNGVSGSHSFSVYVAAAGYGFATVCVGSDGALNYYAVVIDLSNGTKTATYSRGTQTDKTCTVEAVGSYYRVTISGDGEQFYIVGPVDTGTYTTNSYGFKAFSADGTSGILVYGAQLEAGSTPSSYIPTAGATATRAADLLTVPVANLPYDNTNMSIQIDGKMTYADTSNSSEVKPYRWRLSYNNYINSGVSTLTGRTGKPIFNQRQSTSGLDSVAGADTSYSPDVNVPFNLASRHGSTFINGAHEGTLLTANTTPTTLPDLSSTNLILGDTFMGTIGQFRMWSDDLTGAGIAEAST